MFEEMAGRIFRNESFRKDYDDLLSITVYPDIGSPLQEASISRLIETASIFSLTSSKQYRDKAYGIISGLVDYDFEMLSGYQGAVETVLARLGNAPAIDFFRKKIGNEVNASEPHKLFEIAWEIHDSSVIASGAKPLVLTRFQKNLWNSLNDRCDVVVNAPTSAGKSFVVKRYMLLQAAKREVFKAVYLVPTRALMAEFVASFGEVCREENLSVEVTSAPTPEVINENSKFILVLTQERLKGLLNELPSLEFDLVVVDEAQQIGDSSRGGLLETVLLEINKKDTQLAFLSPPATNLELFSQKVPGRDFKIIEERVGTVGQNVILVDTSFGSRLLLSIWEEKGKTSQLVNIPHSVSDIHGLDGPERLAASAYLLANSSASLIYASSASACETVAGRLIKDLGRDKLEGGSANEIAEAAQYIADTIHPKYALVRAVQHGIGFHYGNMPSHIRKVVEDLFSKGSLDYLVSTSTLLFGVNLPAKNIFLFDPRRGSEDDKDGVALKPSEFWNLVGRAGRLGKEWAGNVFLLDYKDWSRSQLDEPREASIESGFDFSLANKRSEILSVARTGELTNESGDIDSKAKIWQLLAKLHMDGWAGWKSGYLEALGFSSTEIADIKRWMATVDESAILPKQLMQKHPGIMPSSQNLLAHDFYSRLVSKERTISDFEIKYPLDSEGYSSLIAALNRINKHFYHGGYSQKQLKLFCGNSMDWMKGKSIAEMIKKYHAWREKNSVREISVDTSIRSYFKLIETEIRFRIARDVDCYLEILNYVNDKLKLKDKIGNVSLYIELGACDEFSIYLMGRGVSRASALSAVHALSKARIYRQTNREKLLALSNPIVTDYLSAFALRELKRMLLI